jgi:hypothetical protein
MIGAIGSDIDYLVLEIATSISTRITCVLDATEGRIGDGAVEAGEILW